MKNPNIMKPIEDEINGPVMEEPVEGQMELPEAPAQVDWEAKCELLKNNLESAYAKIRQLEKQISDKAVKERSADMLISQAVSVLSNTVMLAIKNKEN